MAKNDKVAAYGDDLAYIHDSMPDFAEGSAPGLLSMFAKHGLDSGLVVDMGCGGGIWADRLVTAGYEVVGVDISPSMVDIARKRVPDASFHVSSCLDFEIPKCKIVTGLGEVLGYLFDKTNSPKALAQVCRRVFRTLEPGGLFVFDLAEIEVDRNRPKTYWEGDDWTCLVAFEVDYKKNILTRNIVTYRKVGKLYRRGQEVHRLQLYQRADVMAMLSRVGFKVRSVRRYGDYRLLKNRIGFIARKPLSANRS